MNVDDIVDAQNGVREVEYTGVGYTGIQCPGCYQALLDCTTYADVQRRYVCTTCRPTRTFVEYPPHRSDLPRVHHHRCVENPELHGNEH